MHHARENPSCLEREERLMSTRSEYCIMASHKPMAYLINIGRGEIVDEEDLIHVFGTCKIAGAALDIFCTDPFPKSVLVF